MGEYALSVTACGGATSPGGRGKGWVRKWKIAEHLGYGGWLDRSSHSLAPPLGELSAQLTERA